MPGHDSLLIRKFGTSARNGHPTRDIRGLGVHFTVGLHLDVSRSEDVCGVLERLPMTAVVLTSCHVRGTPPADQNSDSRRASSAGEGMPPSVQGDWTWQTRDLPFFRRPPLISYLCSRRFSSIHACFDAHVP